MSEHSPARAAGTPDAAPGLLAQLDSPDPDVRARAATALHRAGHPRALEACLRTLDDAPDPLHADHTPSVQCLIESGARALPPLLELLDSERADTRMHAERAVMGITRRLAGFDGRAWPEGAMERWMAWWSGIGYDSDAGPAARAGAIDRLREALPDLAA